MSDEPFADVEYRAGRGWRVSWRDDRGHWHSMSCLTRWGARRYARKIVRDQEKADRIRTERITARAGSS